MSNLLMVALPGAGGAGQSPPEVPSSLNYSVLHFLVLRIKSILPEEAQYSVCPNGASENFISHTRISPSSFHPWCAYVAVGNADSLLHFSTFNKL